MDSILIQIVLGLLQLFFSEFLIQLLTGLFGGGPAA